jgi:hypothetical protein
VIDYTKKGKTPPGTKHTPPPRPERRTWLDIVAPHPDHIARGDRPEPASTATFTAAVRSGDPRPRRERRADPNWRPPELFTDEFPVQALVESRKSRRLAVAYRERRRRKGQRAFTRTQLAKEAHNQTVLGQMAVLEAGPDAPGNEHRYRNIYNAMLRKYGEQFLAAQS